MAAIDRDTEAVVKALGEDGDGGQRGSVPNVAKDALTVGGEVPADASGDPRGGVLNGIPGKMRVPGCGLHLGVTEQLPNHREAFAQRQGAAGVRVPEIVWIRAPVDGVMQQRPRMTR